MNKIRLRGFFLFLVGIGLFLLLMLFAYKVLGDMRVLRGGLALPVVIALAGLLELVTGMSFGELSARWNQVPPHVQWILYVPLVFVGCAILALIAYGVFSIYSIFSH